jgi:hypothetical protein
MALDTAAQNKRTHVVDPNYLGLGLKKAGQFKKEKARH